MMKRRIFIGKLAGWCAGIAGAIVGISYLKQLSPNVIGKDRKFRLGKVSDFPVDTFTLVEDHGIYIYRDNEAIKAVSAVCTHLGCTVRRTTAGFECPCHGSCYSESGEVLSGPAPKPLNWFYMEKAADGHLVVDMNYPVGAEVKLLIG